MSPAWFFSTMSQAMATIIGFIISLLAVLQQLRYDRKKRRIDEFKTNFIQFNQKYSNSTGEVMQLLKDFFHGSIPTEVPKPDRIDGNFIENILEENPSEYPITNGVWLHIYNINSKLNSIESSENIDQGEMPPEHKILEIKQSLEHISGSISKGNTTITDEMELCSDSEELSIKNDIFSESDTRHMDLETWFDRYFVGDSDQGQYGHDILSIVNYFEEMEKDFEELFTSYKAATSTSEEKLSKSMKYIILITFTGVFVPILSLLTFPDSFISFSDSLILKYQIMLTVVLFIMICWLLTKVTSYLPLDY